MRQSVSINGAESQKKGGFFRGSVGLQVWLIAAAGYATAAWGKAAISWDGSWYLFNTLARGRPFIANGRLSNWALLGPSALVRDFFSVPGSIVFYGCVLAMAPLAALAICFWFLRGERLEALRIWAVFGILLAPLPGQWCLQSEATFAVQLLWPILAILAAGLPAVGAVALGPICVLLFFLHPTAAAPFVISGALCAHQFLRSRQTRWWVWAVVFGLLAAGRIVLTALMATGYEKQQMAPAIVGVQLVSSLGGWASVYLVGVALMAAGCFRGGKFIYGLGGLLALAGLWWAASPTRWEGALNYRRFALPISLPLVLCALQRHRCPCAVDSRRLRDAALLFFVIILAQAVSWRGLLARFERTIRQAPGTVVLRRDAPFVGHTALDHWSAFTLSVILQGREPARFFVREPSDVSSDGKSIRVSAWDRLKLNDGWFKLAPLRQSPAAR